MAAPRSIKAATAKLERYAELDGQIAAVEADRQDAIAAINARCDTAANDLIAERDRIAGEVETWWTKSGHKLLSRFTPSRKTMELGGCVLGTRSSPDSLSVAGKAGAIAEALQATRWGRKFVRTTFALKRRELLDALDGPNAEALAELGLTRQTGAETFQLSRADQDGTMGSTR